MRGWRFDWRWLLVIGFIAVMANAQSLPWFVTSLTLGGAGGYLLIMAWRAWNRSAGWSRNGRRVVYWRGQRYEMHGPPRRIRFTGWSELAPVLVYALVGLAMLLAALAVLLRAL